MLSSSTLLPEEHPFGQMQFLGIPICCYCGTAGYRGEQFCPRCGGQFQYHQTQQHSQQRCPACGAVVRHPIAFFCTECGSELNESNTEK